MAGRGNRWPRGQPKRSGFCPGGNYVWDVKGLSFAWKCEVRYEVGRIDVVEVQLASESRGAAILASSEAHIRTCCERGLQPYGNRKRSEGVDNVLAAFAAGVDIDNLPPPENVTVEEWGVLAHLSTSVLTPELFRGVIRRLDETMMAVEAAVPNPSH
jgi:hypothetical protein